MKCSQVFCLLFCLVSWFASSSQQNITAASNGLTKSGNTVLLGGNLTQPTLIDLGASYTFKFSKGTSDYFFLDNSGNIGIGTSSPAAQLHATGSVRFQGLSTNNSLTNMVAADANGNLSLRDASTFGTNFILNQSVTKQLAQYWIQRGKADTLLSDWIKSSTSSSMMKFGRFNETYIEFFLSGNTSREVNFSVIGDAAAVQALNNSGTPWGDFIVSNWSSANGAGGHVSLHSGNGNWTRWTRDGRFLIGTLIDDSVNRLQVNGRARIGDIPNATIDPDHLLVSDGGVVKYMTKAQLGIGSGGGTNYWTQSSTDISYNNGNVGIGITNPDNSESWGKLLEVRGYNHSKFLVSTTNENILTCLWSHDGAGFGGAPAGGMVGTSSNHPFSILTNKISRIIVTTGGDVGIGTSNPQAKLAVNGDIFSKKVKVTQSGWSDYVFDDAYKLPTLTEVEKYIQCYKHLPDVPSAKDVDEKGLDLGDNQALLLKKIEELTLYVIDMNKQVNDMHKTVEKVSKENALLKNKLENMNK